MVTIKHLPTEVCYQILRFLSKKDPLACTTLCKIWYQAATEAFYKETTIQQSSITYLTSKFNLKPQEEGYQNLENGRWVLQLKILDEDNDMDVFGQDDFQQMLSFLPNLEILDLSGSSHCIYYLGILLHIDSSIYLKKIKEIVPYSGLEDFISDAALKTRKIVEFAALRNFSNSITTLEMICFNDTTSRLNATPLSNFKCLTHLDISDAHAACVTLFDILEHCQNLKRLKISFQQFLDTKAKHSHKFNIN